MRWRWLFLAVWGGCLFFLSIDSPLAWAPRKPLIYGIGDCSPLEVKSVTYPQARAEAWLKAVTRGEMCLRQDVNVRLRQLGLPLREGRRAFAALAYPLDVVTPEQVADTEVRVFLRDNVPTDKILEEPWRLLLEMCILWETEQAVASMRKAQKSAKSRDKMASVDEQALLLRQLWLAATLNAVDSRALEEDWRQLGKNDASVGLLLMHAGRSTHIPQRIAMASKAIELCMDREVAHPASPLWSVLAAYGNFLRAGGHERLGQPALAETDLDTAINRLRASGIMPGIELTAILARAELRRKRGKIPGMCEDYYAICGLGRCQHLAQARREGLCNQ